MERAKGNLAIQTREGCLLKTGELSHNPWRWGRDFCSERYAPPVADTGRGSLPSHPASAESRTVPSMSIRSPP